MHTRKIYFPSKFIVWRSFNVYFTFKVECRAIYCFNWENKLRSCVNILYIFSACARFSLFEVRFAKEKEKTKMSKITSWFGVSVIINQMCLGQQILPLKLKSRRVSRLTDCKLNLIFDQITWIGKLFSFVFIEDFFCSFR